MPGPQGQDPGAALALLHPTGKAAALLLLRKTYYQYFSCGRQLQQERLARCEVAEMCTMIGSSVAHIMCDC